MLWLQNMIQDGTCLCRRDYGQSVVFTTGQRSTILHWIWLSTHRVLVMVFWQLGVTMTSQGRPISGIQILLRTDLYHSIPSYTRTPVCLPNPSILQIEIKADELGGLTQLEQ